MKSTKRNRPQNLHPDALLQSRKVVAQGNEEVVRATVQAMQRRKTNPTQITVQAVAKESGVSAATIYRRSDLFDLIRKVNPELKRRLAEQMHRNDLVQLEGKLADVEKERAYSKNEVELAKIASRRFQVENTQLRKKLFTLEREMDRLKDQLAACTCEKKDYPMLVPMP